MECVDAVVEPAGRRMVDMKVVMQSIGCEGCEEEHAVQIVGRVPGRAMMQT